MPNISVHQLNFSYQPENKLISNLSIQHNQGKLAIVGRNGSGKSTLLKLLAGEIKPVSGVINTNGRVCYCPQALLDNRNQTVADLLGVNEILQALERISQGSVAPSDFDCVGDNWDIAEQAQYQLDQIKLGYLSLNQYASQLSGGELSKLLLARGLLSKADFILLDEPTNHLDMSAKKQLLSAINNSASSFVIVSHDRTLLNQMDAILALTPLGGTLYGGNYDFYLHQKALQETAIEREIADCEKQLKKAKRVAQETKEKYEQRSSRASTLRKKNDQPKIMQNFFENRAGLTAAKIANQSEVSFAKNATALNDAKGKKVFTRELNLNLTPTNLKKNKLVLEVSNITFSYPNKDRPLFESLSLAIYGPERLAIIGPNGCGKSTLIKLILGELTPSSGTIKLGDIRVQYLDQSIAFLNPNQSILDNFIELNPDLKQHQAHEVLANFLFRNVDALKPVSSLSGGEKLRAGLACLLKSKYPPQLLILDEPSNHLDLESLEHLESALLNFNGAIIVISHDAYFLEKIGIEREINIV